MKQGSLFCLVFFFVWGFLGYVFQAEISQTTMVHAVLLVSLESSQ
jgi:hypothetical protein